MLALWWVWALAGLALLALCAVAPEAVLLGFAFGALVTALVLGLGGPLDTALTGSVPLTLLFFAAVSLVAWLAMRRLLGVRPGQAKTFERDINED